MEFTICAKFIGSYMPDKRTRIGDCIISKESLSIENDRPAIPVRSRDLESYSLEKGVRNYIHFPQRLVSVRTFESEYIITTKVVIASEYDALRVASERFFEVALAMSLAAKNKQIRVGGRRIKRGDENYDFEIVGLFVKKNGRKLRLKIPEPSITAIQFFPKKFPKNFVPQVKKYLSSNDQTFRKGLIYFQRANAPLYSGHFNDLRVILNFVKCIEVVCESVGKQDRFGLSRKKYGELIKKQKIQYGGTRIGVTKESIGVAKKAWDTRNGQDVAHGHPYFNPYSRESSSALLNLQTLESCAAQFLIKYLKYINE